MKKSDVYLIISNVLAVGVFSSRDTFGTVTCASLCLIWLWLYISTSAKEEREKL